MSATDVAWMDKIRGAVAVPEALEMRVVLALMADRAGVERGCEIDDNDHTLIAAEMELINAILVGNGSVDLYCDRIKRVVAAFEERGERRPQ